MSRCGGRGDSARKALRGVFIAVAWLGRSAVASDASDGTFHLAPDMAFARYASTATVLSSGAVALYGPAHDGDEYDPANGTWNETALIPAPRFNAHLLALSSGDALLVGGDPTDAHTVRYATATRSWAWGPSLTVARRFEQTTLLSDGRIFVAGGYGPDGAPTKSAEIYDPANEVFSATGAMPRARAGGIAELLPNGRVLIAGGVDASGYGDPCSLIYSPMSGTFSSGPCFYNATHGLFTPASARLHDGRVLVSGGYTYIGGAQRVAADAEVYDPAANRWTSRLSSARAEHTLTTLDDGRVIAIGGVNDWNRPIAQADIFDPTADAFHAGPTLAVARFGHTATALPGNRVLVAGGQIAGNEWSASAEVYIGDTLMADGFEQGNS